MNSALTAVKIYINSNDTMYRIYGGAAASFGRKAGEKRRNYENYY